MCFSYRKDHSAVFTNISIHRYYYNISVYVIVGSLAIIILVTEFIWELFNTGGKVDVPKDIFR